ncbi:MAG TPA: P1 family peptidase [Gemmatimonadales bacterium]|jgi:D-aminopeptidase
MIPVRQRSILPALASITIILPAVLSAQQRPRARDLGITPGIFATGARNAITDVAGVLVGQSTVIEGDSVHTGITAILPHAGDLFHDRVPAALHVGNGFGKLIGATQLGELGELETPILLTCTLCVWKAADAMVAWELAKPGMQSVRSINPVVAETNDGTLNAIRSRPIRPEQVVAALESASNGDVAEGSVGAGAGTIAFEWKGGIGTSSRKLPASLGGYTVGVLVQSNFGGVLQLGGAPVGIELRRFSYRNNLLRERGDGSCVIVVATDAPLSDHQLERLAARGIMGLARTGADGSNGSGDYALAFSTSPDVRRHPPAVRESRGLDDDAVSPVFEAAIEATEEAIDNSILRATSVTSRGRTVAAIDIDSVRAVLARHHVGKKE